MSIDVNATIEEMVKSKRISYMEAIVKYSDDVDGEIEMERWTLSEVDMDLIFEIKNNEKWLKAINNSFIRL